MAVVSAVGSGGGGAGRGGRADGSDCAGDADRGGTSKTRS